ncbi:MAG: DUF6443 domain-containing protein, partial [Flavobacteriales bacterium]|nr:DUF6443 domain-containing protein [Flavobacteriales bacterium]
MKAIYFKLIFTFFITSIMSINAQDSYLQDNVNPTPEAAALGKYGDIPVGLHTGIPAIGVPLYTLSEGRISVPLSLSYHASGVKVEEISSWTGLGWSLQGGGMISRVVRSAPDEGTRPMQASGYFSDCGHDLVFGSTYSGYKVEDATHGRFDTEPDLFHFNFNGYSGKFFFDDQRRVHQIRQSDIKIEPILTSYYGNNNPNTCGIKVNFDGFKVTTPDGMQYFFGENEAIDSVTTAPAGAINLFLNGWTRTNWHLTKILTPNHSDSIVFEYEREVYGYYNSSAGETVTSRAWNSKDGAINHSGQGSPNKSIVYGRRLSKISSSTNSISFIAKNLRNDVNGHNLTNGSLDVNTSAKYLSEIIISDKNGQKLKSFDFDITTLQSPLGNENIFDLQVTGGKDRNRLILNKVTEYNELGTDPKVHNFKYKSLNLLPRRISYAQDHWGFYNGFDTNLNLFPYLEWDEGLETFKTVPPPSAGTANYSKFNANREPSWPECSYGILEEITYPTGGKTVFDFEPHDAWRVETDCHYNTFKPSWSAHDYSSSTTGGVIHTRNNVQFTKGDTALGEIVITANRKKNIGTGEVYLSFFIPGQSTPVVFRGGTVTASNQTGEDEYRTEIELSKLPNLQPDVDYDLEVKVIGVSANIVFRHKYLDCDTLLVNTMVGGARIKSITTKDGSGENPNIVKSFEYNRLDTNLSSGIDFARPEYGVPLHNDLWGIANQNDFIGMYCFAQGAGPALAKVDVKEYNPYKIWAFSSSTLTPMQTTSGQHVGYQVVSEVTNNNGKVIHIYDTTNFFGVKAPYYNPNNWPRIDAPLSLQLGNHLQEIYLDHNNDTVKKVTYTYENYKDTNLISVYNDPKAVKINVVGLPPACDIPRTGIRHNMVTETIQVDNGGAGTVNDPLIISDYYEVEYIGGASFTTSTTPKINWKGTEQTTGLSLYNMETGVSRLVKVRTEDFFKNNSGYHIVETEKLTEYGNKHHAPISEEFVNSDGFTHTTNYQYVADLACPNMCFVTDPELEILTDMYNKNMLHIPIEKSSFVQKPGSTPKLLGASMNIYKLFEGNKNPENYKLSSIRLLYGTGLSGNFDKAEAKSVSWAAGRVLEYDSKYESPEYFFEYDALGNLVSQYRKDGVKESFVYDGNDNTIAKVLNAEQDEVSFLNFETDDYQGWDKYRVIRMSGGGKSGLRTARFFSNAYLKKSNLSSGTYLISFWSKNQTVKIYANGSLIEQIVTGSEFERIEKTITVNNQSNNIQLKANSGHIDDVKLYPADALMTNYVFDGNNNQLLATISENDVYNHFEYDDYQRLKLTKNDDNEILTYLDYKYDPIKAINEIHTYNTLISGITKVDTLLKKGTEEVAHNIEYTDGIGRRLQSVNIAASPKKRDIISFTSYDDLGRETKAYLPYTAYSNGAGGFRKNAKVYQNLFYGGAFSNNKFAYTENEFDGSPLNRITKIGQPGKTWALGNGHEIRTTRRSNFNYEVPMLRDGNLKGYFPANSLYVEEVYNEDGNLTTTFKDKMDRVIMTKTGQRKLYNVYDNKGRLSAVIPPQTMENMISSGNYSYLTSTNRAGIYYYVYDKRDRLLYKDLPGKGTETFYYDRLD